ncbi:kynureninase [Kibdelosporangium banguiense]|uniref:Kynureninase n=1 Tax=Kibdelosporangium banguiense TaxID=1365924 RepID=A0ABS4TL94_9PSEU|nr:aminotransferase class V-fold PLP-dependent enzyme [Kibdelosporangium banguiense]MBP2325202.1 kynureninase [Kibdelosporangium banguiense]
MDVRALDAADELAEFANRFLPIGDPGVVAYLDGNSLGRPPTATLNRLHQLVTHEWGTRMIRSWEEGWMQLPEQVGDLLGSTALGAAPGQVIVADSTTICLHKVLRAAVAMRPGRPELVTDTDNFPTDRYVVQAIAAQLGLTVRWIESDPAGGVRPEQVAEVVGDVTAAVTFSHVAYRSAFIADMAAINDVAHAAGAVTVWDLCHSAGSIPVRLDATGTDFAVGCTYKFLNAGPGAPAFLYVRAEHHDELQTPLAGWIGNEDVFEMGPVYRPAKGIRRMLSGTPNVLGLAAVEEGVKLLAEAGIDRVRAKSTALTRLAIELADEWLPDFTVASPREDEIRGGHVTITHPDAENLAPLLIANGVIVDFRQPDGIRIGLSPLSTSFTGLHAAMARIRDLTAPQ